MEEPSISDILLVNYTNGMWFQIHNYLLETQFQLPIDIVFALFAQLDNNKYASLKKQVTEASLRLRFYFYIMQDLFYLFIYFDLFFP